MSIYHDDVAGVSERQRGQLTSWLAVALTSDPQIWNEFRSIFRNAGLKLDLEPIEKWAFYKAVATPEHVLTIQTADLQIYANLLLTIGVRRE